MSCRHLLRRRQPDIMPDLAQALGHAVRPSVQTEALDVPIVVFRAVKMTSVLAELPAEVAFSLSSSCWKLSAAFGAMYVNGVSAETPEASTIQLPVAGPLLCTHTR